MPTKTEHLHNKLLAKVLGLQLGRMQQLRQASFLVLRGLLLRWLGLLLHKDGAGHDVVADHELVADRVVVGAPTDHIL